MAQVVNHPTVDVEPILLETKLDEGPAIGKRTDVLSPLSPFSSSTDSTLSPVSPLESNHYLRTVDAAMKAPALDDATKDKSTFKLGTASIDEDRPMKIVVIGAGFSGIIAGIRFPQRMKNIDLTIYDKNAGIGGTWFTNKYPGLACDIPSHCYQLTFEENTQWSAFYAPGSEIRAYLERVVEKYKLMRYIKLNHELIKAQYDESAGKWHLKLRRPISANPTDGDQYEIVEDTADFVLAGVGGLSRWNWPDIPGLSDFKGTLRHSAAWEGEDWKEGVKEWGDKKVGVIGVGSSAIQIVPAIRPYVKKVYNYVRGKTWLSPPFASAKVAELLGRDPTSANYQFSDEDKRTFEDSEYYKTFRHDLESELNSVHFTTIRGSELQKLARAAFKENMIKKLEKKPWIADHILPDFPVTCRRLTPGPGYLEALCEDNVDFITTHIKRVTGTGIELVDGTHHDLDIIVCATGYDTSYQYPFPIIGRGGTTLNERFSPHPETYLAVCTDGFPNWFMVRDDLPADLCIRQGPNITHLPQTLGPNSGVGSGSLLVVIERQIDYAIAAAKKMQREYLKSIEAKKEAVLDFDEYLEHYFQTTVYSEKCRSWYKRGKEEGRIVGLWPGSCLHAVRTIEHPRWEDYNYEPLDESGTRNRFYWLGDGSTYNEKHMVGDRAWYLNHEEVDIPPVPE